MQKILAEEVLRARDQNKVFVDNMQSKPLTAQEETIAIRKQDLIEAWTLLERVVISLRKIGSWYAIPQGQGEQTPEQEQQMRQAIGQFMSPELWRELSHARVVLGEYLPDEEAEEISDRLSYWEPKTDQK